MPKAAEVISFPLDAATTGFLREYSGTTNQRLDRIVCWLDDISNLIQLARASEDVPPGIAGAFSAIETALQDCIAVAELRPVGARL